MNKKQREKKSHFRFRQKHISWISDPSSLDVWRYCRAMKGGNRRRSGEADSGNVPSDIVNYYI